MRNYLSLFLVMLLFSCQTKRQPDIQQFSQKESLSERVKRLSAKYNLTQTAFDYECIYSEGDLTKVVSTILKDLLPDQQFEITEAISPDGKQYVAKLKINGGQEIDLFADTHADFLPEGFSYILESIPRKIGSDKRFYMINPRLLGQDAWYLCGTEANLMAAKGEGLPLICSSENYMEMDISEFE